MRERLLLLLIIMLATAFFGEMKVNPFGGPFRFSLGIAAFFFGLLWFQSVPVLLIGFLTGAFTMWFRVGLDVVAYGAVWQESLFTHVPSAFYYFSFTLLFQLTRARRYVESPLLLGLIGATVDCASNLVELLAREISGVAPAITWESIMMLLFFGALRSFFAVGLYNSFSIRQVRAVGEVRQQELERLRMINTGLYEETFYLRKSMTQLEDITRESYQLYRHLLSSENTESSRALHIAEHVHEVKKDSQRMLAGLLKIINQKELSTRLSISELCGLVIRANQKYAEMLGKQILFTEKCNIILSTSQIYELLSVLNNLVANAVEAIPISGKIELLVEFEKRDIIFHVIDNGSGILQEDKGWIFELGYTTKYDREGKPSTGIGLTHAKGIIGSLDGMLTIIQESEPLTHFEVRIPTDQIVRKEGVMCFGFS
ncbi:sensor histidine kinase [Brevibacillus laterosporus]|nr:sensor histidine kinase [Brevibacillus laterosporus]TPG70165.1 sensor histidine kinase [Brevibacillus laterosporus]